MSKHRLVKAGRRDVLRSFPDRLLKEAVRRCVVELNCADPAQVVHVSGELVVVRRLGEDTLADKLVRLVVKVVMQVVPQQKVHERGLAVFISA